MKIAVGIVAAALTASGPAALVDAAAGQACAVKLPGDSFLIYAAAMANRPTRGNWQSVVEAQARALAADNRIATAGARDSETAAGTCVKAAVE